MKKNIQHDTTLPLLQNGLERFRDCEVYFAERFRTVLLHTIFQNCSELFRTVLERFWIYQFFLQNGLERFCGKSWYYKNDKTINKIINYNMSEKVKLK